LSKLTSFLKVTKWIQSVFILEAIYIFICFKYNEGFNLILGKTELTSAQLLNALGIFIGTQILMWYLYNQNYAKAELDKFFEESDVVGNLRR